MSQDRARGRVVSIDQAIRSALWVALDLLALANQYTDDEETTAAIYEANAKILDTLALMRGADWSQVPF